MTFAINETDRASWPFANGRIGLIVGAAMMALYVTFGFVVALHIHHRLDPSGAPLFYDFSAFYQAGRFADIGHAAAAYDDTVMKTAQQASFPGATTRLPWNYPPTFQLLFMPLAALPYLAAWLVWTIGGYALYALMARQLAPPRHLWLVLFAPAAAINVLVGQNGLLSTALMGAGVLLLTRRPVLGGVLLGLISYKPHFALLVPLALLCGREWRALAGAAASGAGMALLALATFGSRPWIAFARKALHPAGVISSSSSSWRNIPSVQVLARTLGLDPTVGSVLHWAVAAAAALATLWIWRRTTDPRLRAGALAAATLLVTPYLRLYDLALLILPIIAALPNTDARSRVGVWGVLIFAWVLPVVLMFAAPPIQIGPLATISLLGLIITRAAKSGRGAPPATANATMTLTLDAP